METLDKNKLEQIQKMFDTPLIEYTAKQKLSEIDLELNDIVDKELLAKITLNFKGGNSIFYYISLQAFSDFVINLSDIILEKKKNLINFYELVGKLNEGFLNLYFGHMSVRYTNISIHLPDHLVMKILHKDRNKYLILSNYKNQDFLLRNYYLGFQEWIEQGIINAPEKNLLIYICEILRNYEDVKIDTKRLTLLLNSSSRVFGIPKPIDEDIIKSVIESNLKRFNIDENGFIKLSDDNIYIMEKLKAEKFKLNKILNKQFNEGFILAIHFNSSKFPIHEAEEYVKMNPIIYIDLFSDKDELHNFLNHLFIIHNTNSLELDARRRNDFKILLNKFLPENVDKLEWLEKNCLFSYYEEVGDVLKPVLSGLINSVSPIFNVRENKNNLFYKKLIEFIE